MKTQLSKLHKLLLTLTLSFTLVMALSFTALSLGTVVTIEGNSSGISVQSSDKKLFDVDSMVPGDSSEATLHIVNNDSSTFKLYLHGQIPASFENNTETSNDLSFLSRLQLSVTYQGSQIYPDGSVPVPPGGDIESFAPGETNQIYLGAFNQGDTADLVAKVQFLSSDDSDNAYQGKSAEIDWVLTAVVESSGGDDDGHHDHNGGGGDNNDEEPTPTEIIIPEVITPEAPPIEPTEVIAETTEPELPMPGTGLASPLPITLSVPLRLSRDFS